ncbi:MAG: bifunctional folylpolyglutamate synthase/dihydrofolate synthase [Muribaculaceae bacterium]|nr:bifunctional folylpolyglutamate synthase/dihydrofolate synthase [Muribaculaceae bacterium]
MEEKYKEALEYLYSQLPMFSRVGAAAYKPGLERVERLSEYFGNPEKKLKAIHIAGTNGKGSTSHIIASVLQACGYKTALYTSPHLIDFRERIKINGKMIPKEKVVEFVEKWKNCDYTGDRPSFFELTMMMAFCWFAEEDVDYAVIETGMGGRLDSTNIIHPILCVITNISPDHTQFLGHTPREIAAEKAGIIKEGIPVVIGEADEDTESVFLMKALEKGSPLTKVYRNPEVDGFKLKSDFSGWEAESDWLGEIEVDLAGEYQKKNIPTAIAAIKILSEEGLDLPVDGIKNGLAKAAESTGLYGRWSVISRSPITICDTGHNIGGLRINISQLEKLKSIAPENSKLRMLIGFVADKAIDEILDIFPAQAEYYLTRADIPRALPENQLLEKFEAHGLKGRKYPSVEEAWKAIQEEKGKDDIIYVGGSTFIVADFLKSLVH